MSVTPITSLDQYKEFINSGQLVVIDFWAEWCGPCRMISPVFERMAGETKDVTFAKVNIDEQSDIAEEAGIKVLPTFIAFKDGQSLGEVNGANPAQLTRLITSNVNADA